MPYQLFLSLDEWKLLPERAADPVLERIAASNRTALAAIRCLPGGLRGELPSRLDREGQPFAWWWRSHRVVLERCVVAWRLGDHAALADALTGIDALLARADWRLAWKDCHLNHADLKTGELASVCAFALDTLAEELGAARRARLAERAAHDLLEPYLAGIAGGDWWRRADFNWGPALHGPCGLLALALRDGHPALARRALAAARTGISYALEGFRAGGGWIEGLMYGTSHIGQLVEFAAALHRVDGDDLGLGGNRDLADLLDVRPAQLAPDGGPFNFSGATAQGVEWWMPQAYWLAARHHRPAWTAFEDAHVKPWWDAHGLFHDVSAFWFRPVQPPLAEPAIPRLTHLQAVDWLTWRGEGAWLGVRGGSNGGNRCNRDLGAFILGAGPDRFFCDPGWGEGPTSRHNTVTVRGADQGEAVARIVRRRDQDGWLFAALDLGACYPTAIAYHRRFFLVIDGCEILLVDDLLAHAGGRPSARFHLQTALPVERNSEGFVLRGQAANLHATLPPHAGWTIIERTDAEAQRPYRTLTWISDVDRPHCLHPVRFGLGAPPTLTWERRDDGLFVTCRGRRWRLELDALVCEELA